MMRNLIRFVGLLIAVSLTFAGCSLPKTDIFFSDEPDPLETVATEIEYPDAQTPGNADLIGQWAPRTIHDESQVEYWPLTLEEVVAMALTYSEVLRDLGGTILRAPQSVRTTFGPAIRESDPRFGVEGALSAFDTEFSSSLFFEKNDRRLNNQGLGNLGIFQQDYDVFQTALTKRAVTGSRFTLRKNVDFDKNSSLGNQFPRGAWNVNLEGEARHPLLQGGGLEFNRIAGPDGIPGVANGVLIARVRTDISLADFEMALRDFVSEVENAYWDLYFAYRDLDAKIKARDAALVTWRKINAQREFGRVRADKEAQARTQYYRFKEEVQNALTGRLLEGTRTDNGSDAGTFRGFPGVQVHERKLRLLIGLPINGPRLIRPADEPPAGPVTFDWNAIAEEALTRRAELRRQKWQIKRREMELIASRNHLLPNLDLVGRYRWRGFGEKLLDADSTGKPPFDNAYMDLTSGDFQEWQVGVEFMVPLGFREAHAGVRNAQLHLSRARAVLREQEREVVHNLSDSVADVGRAYAILETSYSRDASAKDQLQAIEAAHDAQKVDFFVLLDAQRRCAEAESHYYQSRVEYALALRNLHFEKGSLLAYCGVILSEGPWPSRAYIDAAERERLRGRPRPLNYAFSQVPIVSQGTYPQQPAFEMPMADPNRMSPFVDEPPPLREIGPAPPPPQGIGPPPLPPQGTGPPPMLP